jgi:mannose-6-phosphate isomerase-like protein (cupin superfamily)
MEPFDILKHKGKFFEILKQTKKSQVAAMTLAPGKDSGPEEIHKGDQILYVIEGEGEVEIENRTMQIKGGQAVIIPAGSQHHVYNTSDIEFFCLNIYAPPEY